MEEVFSVAIRAIHILSVVVLIGSAFYIGFVEKGAERIPAWYLLAPVAGVLGSGIWQFLSVLQSGAVAKGWHMVFGIKSLFVLHILAVTLLQMRVTAGEAKRKRWMTGIAASGTLVIVLSGILRLLHGNG